MFKNFDNVKYNKGVTLIELLVVIFIFVVISGITIFDYGKFKSSLSIQNLADDIALSVRKAQGYAIGVHRSSSVFDTGYGIHFSVNQENLGSGRYSGTDKSFVIFSDINNDKIYDYGENCGTPATGDECLELLNISSIDKIIGIRYYDGHVLSDTLTKTKNTLDIVFKRPNPEPTFCYKNDGSDSACDTIPGLSYVQVIISSNTIPAVTKTITISNSGQISVAN
ncbi:MAG: prepilin-type N-terminal cleavage/methylation domain-containing protein [Candidatus Nomurabacteria bacterium]|nr:prepilin-type N-terminal cleavage/methylation domain-containing protein [Candidatus Nomurabacteria bacterium]